MIDQSAQVKAQKCEAYSETKVETIGNNNLYTHKYDLTAERLITFDTGNGPINHWDNLSDLVRRLLAWESNSLSLDLSRSWSPHMVRSPLINLRGAKKSLPGLNPHPVATPHHGGCWRNRDLFFQVRKERRLITKDTLEGSQTNGNWGKGIMSIFHPNQHLGPRWRVLGGEAPETPAGGMGRGCKRPAGGACDNLVWEGTEHAATYFSTFFLMAGQKLLIPHHVIPLGAIISGNDNKISFHLLIPVLEASTSTINCWERWGQELKRNCLRHWKAACAGGDHEKETLEEVSMEGSSNRTKISNEFPTKISKT